MATLRLADDRQGIETGAALLAAGGLVAFATETVYGLGADATNARAVAAIFEAKGRPRFNPLICHFPKAEAAFAHADPPALARHLASRFWPGPLTMVLPRRADSPIALLASAGLETLAVRVPAHGKARELLRALDRPVAAPSANRSGRISPTSAEHVLRGLDGRIAAVIDSGRCEVGVESTVIDLSGTQPVLLRPGGVSIEALEGEIGPVGRIDGQERVTLRSPGMMSSHYAPSLPLRLNAAQATPDEALLGFGAAMPEAVLSLNLSPSGDLAEAAANLFEFMHRLDAEAARLGLCGIAAAPIPAEGLGLAINDRLFRAAAPRI